MTTENQMAWAYLSRVLVEPKPELFARIAEEGVVAVAERVRRLDFPAGSLASEVNLGQDRAAADVAHIEELGGRLVTPDDAEYPALIAQRLAAFANVPPLALWVIGTGRLDELLARSLAVAGTRAPSSYGERVTDDLVGDLVAEGMTPISTGAYGIAGAVHRAALQAGGATVAFLAGGLDRPYPAGHAGLFRRIAEAGGVLVSEYAPSVVPSRSRFVARNRLVATATAGVVVIEAGFRSGTMNTARWAQQHDVPVCAVPGPVTAVTSRACHDLIREGATLVTRASEVLEAIAPQQGEVTVR